ncbi:MAG: cobyric acid synthase [Candidatus Tectimicrobiota bacterium]|nr:MAG: cobyric acid synthase [Candidatus Tectomicrobia bacterium]
MAARALMVQGSSSSVGKSLLVAALCRYFARRGVRVAPFKAQNMSNNAAVCADGAEIGRAQALQALAAGVAPSAEMNPILLKPEGDARAQVVVMGRPWRTLSAGAYAQHKAALWATVTAALDALRARYELVLIEGAGSPAELNLRASDLANMAVARYAQAPVLLVGDIDRGGIFAQLLGTLWLLPPAERALVRALVVNKFRGDPALFAEGVRQLEAASALPVLGVLPWLGDLGLPEEDAVALETPPPPAPAGPAALDLAVIQLPHIANFDDFTPLAAEDGVRLRYVRTCAALGQPHAVLLPGTKSTVADLLWLRRQGLARAIVHLARSGTAVVGICGGYQMLGERLDDPAGVESPRPSVVGLGLLPVCTQFAGDKATYQVRAQVCGGPGWLAALRGQEVSGYEIHMGRTASPRPWLKVHRAGAAAPIADGATDATGRIWGCYLHGLFANPGLRRAWLASLGWKGRAAAAEVDVTARLDALADWVAAGLDLRRLEALVWGS